ncbi:MAG: hypothetical protein NTY98_08210 [Verrucomicrobia bacterium]|nr:hypothetical protein [Verrucomicrobiota bacterium]
MKDLTQIKSACLRPCVDAFHANMTRTCVFSMMPANITWEINRDSIIASNAQFRVRGIERSLRAFALQQPPNDFFEFEMMECEKQLAEYMTWTKDERMAALWNAGVMVVEQQIMDPLMKTSINALYTSVILESWLFFEALVSDLWVAAVDNSTGRIFGRLLANQKWEKPDEKVSGLPTAEANPKTHPGSFWKEVGMVTFQKRRNIEDYYAITFGPEIKSVFKTVASGDIWALNAFRNCIVHSAGKIDPGFKKQAEPFEEFRDLPLKSHLPLDGAITAKLRNAALMTGAALLQKVDELLLMGD